VGLASLMAGCVSPSGQPDNTATGALVGAGTGAAIGALADRRAPGVGALIGAAAGAIAGGLMGHSADEQQAAYRARYFPPPPKPPPSIADIKTMTKNGLSEEVIISQITSTRGVYHLDANSLIDLKNSGVSEKVIACLVNSETTVAMMPSPGIRAEGYLVAPTTEHVWVGGEWTWNGVAWVWVGGRWVLPPFPHAVWVPPYWAHGVNGWYRVGGRWR